MTGGWCKDAGLPGSVEEVRSSHRIHRFYSLAKRGGFARWGGVCFRLPCLLPSLLPSRPSFSRLLPRSLLPSASSLLVDHLNLHVRLKRMQTILVSMNSSFFGPRSFLFLFSSCLHPFPQDIFHSTSPHLRLLAVNPAAVRHPEIIQQRYNAYGFMFLKEYPPTTECKLEALKPKVST